MSGSKSEAHMNSAQVDGDAPSGWMQRTSPRSTTGSSVPQLVLTKPGAEWMKESFGCSRAIVSIHRSL